MEKGGSDGACALVWPGRTPARAEDLSFGVRTTTPSSHRGLSACAILTALPLCGWPDPRAEQLGNKGAQEGTCFRAGPPLRAATPTPSRLCSEICSQSTPSLRKTTETGVAGYLPVLSRPLPFPVALLPTPNSQIWGFLKSPGIDNPVAWTTGLRTGLPFPPETPPCGCDHSPPLSAGLGPVLQRIFPD